MKLAIMQPYFFPYIGYFSLLEYADEFILFDTAQYDRKGWMNRNRILKPQEGWQYIRAGVIKPAFKAPIKDVKLSSSSEWKNMIIRQLEPYKKTAPYYNETIALIQNVLAKPVLTLVDLNKVALEAVRDRLNIQCPINTFSTMNLQIGDVHHAGQWALEISKAYGAHEYVNPPGGCDIFNPDEFESTGVKLTFLQNALRKYNQGSDCFEPRLSIIDVLMFNSAEQTQDLVRDNKTTPADSNHII